MAAVYNEAVQEIIWRLLGSQRAFIPSAASGEKHRSITEGFRGGKTRLLCTTALILSHFTPDNFGFLGRATGKDIKQTLYETFREVCPSSLIVGKPVSIGQTGTEVMLRTIDPRTMQPGLPSKIYFDYIIDRQTGRSHIAGGNWGFFGVSQAEEIKREDYMKLTGRLSRNVPRTFALIESNHQGHNWIFDDFYANGDYNFSRDDIARQVFFKRVVGDNRVGINARSEENRVSNGGFVNDVYFDDLRRVYSPQWQARFLDSSFDDFSGKIYPEYNLRSVHNITAFTIPKHWPYLVTIDPGGTDPWGVAVKRIDEAGNIIVTDTFPQILNARPRQVYEWLEEHAPKEARYVIDYENRPVMIQLQDEWDIVCEPAFKDIYAGIQQTASYFYVMPNTALPAWYKDTQPAASWARFNDKGSPKIFVVSDRSGHKVNEDWCKQHDNYIWDDKRRNEPKAGQVDHYCDCSRYGIAAKPQPAMKGALPSALDRLKDDVTTGGAVAALVAKLKREQSSVAPLHSDGDFGTSRQPQRFIREFV